MEAGIQMVEDLLKARANPNPTYDADFCDDYHYVSPLEYAVRQDHVELVEILFAGGANVHYRGSPEEGEGRWPTYYDVEGDQLELTRAFIKAGAYHGQYEDENDQFWTPLMHAISNGKTKSATLQIKAGCDNNATFTKV